MSEPIINNQYSQITTALEGAIQQAGGGDDVEVEWLTGRTFVDLDNDGAADDLIGTAVLNSGSSYKSFIYLMREDDGAVRLLENNGTTFSAGEGFVTPLDPRHRTLVDPTYEAVRHYVPTADFQVVDFDTSTPGNEIVISLDGGVVAILNVLEVFAEAQ